MNTQQQQQQQHPPKKKIKLQDYLKRYGYAKSNTHAKRLIRDHVVKVNGLVAKSCSLQVHVVGDDDDDKHHHHHHHHHHQRSIVQIEYLSGKRCGDDGGKDDNDDDDDELHAALPPPPICIVYNKPCGMTCTTSPADKYSLNHIEPPVPPGYHPVGRLDQHSHGLLVFSLDGRLTSALLSHTTFCTTKSQKQQQQPIQRIYKIIVQGDVGVQSFLDVGGDGDGDDDDDDDKRRQHESNTTYDNICKLVENGVQTDYGFFKGTILHMERDVCNDYEHTKCTINGGQRTDTFDENYNMSSKRRSDNNSSSGSMLSSITVAVDEGKKRMVRRLFASIGYYVVDLQRIQYGNIKLGPLERGRWRYPNKEELRYCCDLVEHWNDCTTTTTTARKWS
jgi:16S rRNA U516 pseudouridylate synthase RsuA-like enzyme